MSDWQRYTDPVALERMEKGLCPECGHDPGFPVHNGWGGPCGLTDTGAAGRIYQYEMDKAEAARDST